MVHSKALGGAITLLRLMILYGVPGFLKVNCSCDLRAVVVLLLHIMIHVDVDVDVDVDVCCSCGTGQRQSTWKRLLNLACENTDTIVRK